MDIRIIDRARGVITVPTKALGDDVVSAMRHLAAGSATHTGQVEIECDQECFDALKAANPDGLVIETDRPPIAATLDGVPIIVLEG